MKKLIALLIVLALLITPLSVLAIGYLPPLNTEIAQTVYDSTPGYGAATACEGTLYCGQTFTTITAFSLAEIKVRPFKHNNTGTYTVNLMIYACVGGLPSGTSIYNQTYGDIGIPSDSTTPLHSYDLTTPVNLSAGQQYAFVFSAPVASTSNYLAFKGIGDTPTDNYIDGNCIDSLNAGATWETIHNDMAFVLLSQPSMSVLTLGSTVTPSHVNLSGEVNFIGLETTSKCYFQYGATTSYGNDTLINAVDISTPSTIFHTDITNIPLSTTFHYRAVAVPGSGAPNVYGADKVFLVPEYPVLTIDSIDDITYTSASVTVSISDLGYGDSAVDAKLLYSTTGVFSDTISGQFYEINASLGAPQSYQILLSPLSEGTTYNLKLEIRGMESGNYSYSAVKSFRTRNSTQPGFINDLINWLAEHGIVGSGIWWLLCIGLMIGVWLIPPIRQEYKIIGVVLDVLILGTFIAFVLLDFWIIVLLAILAAVVIVAVIVKKAGG